MKQAYSTLINDMLQQYHFKAENMRIASAVADEVRMFSLNDYAFRLSVGLEGLLSAAHASGDQDSAQVLEQLVTQCNGGDIPKPLHH
ncbi:hypothetical protein [Yersinia kristensenii]|uniref:DUF4754 domain-containing protein n=1 Tax=Yersinia kristensenii TaxID=28152 RepID=A0AB73P003_YERKR|nr:hypothetical protein [Yersinia kristensenii]OVZ75015.1 hypothetical protein CBW52_22670 [Yersinia kristensenii]